MSAITIAIALPAVAFLGVIGSFSSALNGLVGRRLGTLRATYVFLAIGALWCVPLVALLEGGSVASLARGLPWYLYLPGLLNVFLIANLIFVVNRIGTMVMTSAMFCGQVVVSIALDHVGYLGLPLIPASPLRLVSAAVLVIGIVVAVTPSGRRGGSPALLSSTLMLPLAMAFAQGAALAVISALNAVLGRETGTFTSTLFFLAPGAAILLLWFVLGRTPLRLSEVSPGFLLPGSLNVIGIAGGVILVPLVGLQFTTAARVTASVLAGLYIDRRGMFGLPQQPVTRNRVLGTGLLTLGVMLTVLG